ncbi:hypothetical protein CYPRO_2352 [Cyclonatronum proteinivorum]|uniref:Uncharacterized protein n=1 Tax=Cyclonatronum proteinivorum TaxID=1457365 RepID=A0A345UM92_9BACT|nr:hypothetical protein [Cyclonatronum proteinivorum]AXJ01594.1 hypothetical protein CYPRO_2352 [Cyclonatronum proteinivorum]
MNVGSALRVVTIPLNREEIVDFLLPAPARKTGAKVAVLKQRPSTEAEQRWLTLLKDKPCLDSLLFRDNPHCNLRLTTTDRLIPVEHLTSDDTFLTRNLGGWAPVWFGVMAANWDTVKTDPMLRNARVLTEYGRVIRAVGAGHQLVAERMEQETGLKTVDELCKAVVRMLEWRAALHYERDLEDKLKIAKALYLEIRDGGPLTRPDGDMPQVPRMVLLDELLGQMARIEERRRIALFEDDTQANAQITAWQQQLKEETGLMLILKAEYIMGRGRCSAVMIAPELGCVVKQPGPEPLHEAHLAAFTHKGQPENHPRLIKDGALVTPAGRIGLILKEGLIERLNHLFQHNVGLCSLMGFITEPYVTGPTLQEYVLEQHDRLTPEVYEFIQLHQQVCEVMGVENGDWHAANFIVMPDKPNPFVPGIPMMIHIDWGAARALTAKELTKKETEARYNQVRNIAFSYQDAHLAKISERLHTDLADSPERRAKLRAQAEKMVNG